MKSSSFILIVLFAMFLNSEVCAQAYFKTEYMGTSDYRDEHNEKVGESKGSAIIYQGGISLPLSMKMNDNNRPTIWGVGLMGSYSDLNNKNFTEDLAINEIMNLGLSVFHVRPLNDKWSMMANLNIGIYSPTTKFSSIGFKQVLGGGAVLFIRHLKPNLEIGGGLALNNTFGYPMVFPALYLNWNHMGKFGFRVQAMDGFELSGDYDISEKLRLSLVAEVNGQMALLEKDNKDMMFTHQYIVIGLRPEFKINKKLSIPFTGGFHAVRMAYFNERTLKGFFRNTDVDPYFQLSPYFSVGIRYGF